MKKEDPGPFVMGCSLIVACTIGVLFFGVMSVGALCPAFAFVGLEGSALGLLAALALVVTTALYRHLRRTLSGDGFSDGR